MLNSFIGLASVMNANVLMGCYFGKIDWASGTLVTSPYDSNSKIIGYDLLYTDN